MTQKYGTQKADDRTLFSCVPYHFIEYFPIMKLRFLLLQHLLIWIHLLKHLIQTLH